MEDYGLTAFHQPLICKFVSNLDLFFNKKSILNIIYCVCCEKKKTVKTPYCDKINEWAY